MKQKFKPEERAEIKLIGWLMENGVECYSNRNSCVSELTKCDIFTIKGGRKKPDMILFDGIEYYILEIKPGDGSSKQTRDSRKIIKYYRNFLEGKTRYFIRNNKIGPKYFLVASIHSPEGKLFKNEEFRSKIRDKIDALKKGVPQREYYKTFGLSRQIWDEWKPYKDKRFAMGCLLSDKLNGGKGCPSVFVQQFNHRLNKWLPPHNFYRIGGLR